MTVAELIEQLRKLDQSVEVGVATDCCGCSGSDLEIEIEIDGSVWIIDRHRR